MLCNIYYCFNSCRIFFLLVFFFKQKTAYEIKECDWSSDVCSSDLLGQSIDAEVVVHPGPWVSPGVPVLQGCSRGPVVEVDAIGHDAEQVGVEQPGDVLLVLLDLLERLARLRSEEHTSELQSHSFISYAVFCLKKKNFFYLSYFFYCFTNLHYITVKITC